MHIDVIPKDLYSFNHIFGKTRDFDNLSYVKSFFFHLLCQTQFFFFTPFGKPSYDPFFTTFFTTLFMSFFTSLCESFLISDVSEISYVPLSSHICLINVILFL